MRWVLTLLMTTVLLAPVYGQPSTMPFDPGTLATVTTVSQTLTGTLEASSTPGWIALTDAAGQSVMVREAAIETITQGAVAGPAGEPTLWKLCSKHFLYGPPRLLDNRYNLIPEGYTASQPGISVLVREGFVVGHLDKYKVPLWVTMRWTKADYDESEEQPRFNRPFETDLELPPYARAETNYEYSRTKMDRGHMTRHKDNAAWGKDNSIAGCLMSNIAPQKDGLNRYAWLSLENAHREIVDQADSGIDTLWMISGTVFDPTGPDSTIGNEIGVPKGTYKVIGWFDARGNFQARGFFLDQHQRARDPSRYLTRIDEIEDMTGLDFFSELDDGIENPVEAASPDNLWGH